MFQDGVRINEAFGDIVNWDFLPVSAISTMQLIPGSNPVFGPNTLGGALAVYTKSGAQYPGASAEVEGGSERRRRVQLEVGGQRDRIDYFATLNAADDRGWAEHNPSRLRQFFGKLGYQDDTTDLDLSLTLANNALEGTQTLPVSFLDTPRAAYTFPDRNDNRLAFLTLKGSRFLEPGLLLSANAYYRRYRNQNVSSNVNHDYGEVDPVTGEVDTREATNDRSFIDQSSAGVAAQLTRQGTFREQANQLTIGFAGDWADTGFRQQSEPASFTADRGTLATGPFEETTNVDTRNRALGVYLTDTLALGDRWTATLAARYNHARVAIADRSGNAAALDGTHTFSRLSPALGINFNPTPQLTAYAGYNEGMRAPTPIELTCADASAPCKLPNIFLADPPLKKVVARTVEAGLRGKVGGATSWSAAAYRSELEDDIQFIAAGFGAANAGFFQNVGRTRRVGLEASATTRVGPVALALRYAHTEATFRSEFTAASPSNSTADANGAITVTRGNRIPGIPADTARLRADVDVGPRLALGATVVYASRQYARGDENNRDVHGPLSGYTVVHADARYELAPKLELFAKVANLFNRRYENFALLGQNVFTGPDRSFGPAAGAAPVSEQFRGVGAPRSAWLGLRYVFF